MNKCAKFHKDSPSGKKVKYNLVRAIELVGDGRFCVQLCIETSCKRATSVAHLTNFSFEFFYDIFTEDASESLRLLYHGAKKSKMTKNSNQGGGGSCLKAHLFPLEGAHDHISCFRHGLAQPHGSKVAPNDCSKSNLNECSLKLSECRMVNFSVCDTLNSLGKLLRLQHHCRQKQKKN